MLDLDEFLGYAYPKRKKIINNFLESKTQSHFPLRLGKELYYLPVFTMSLRMPKYRLNNGRTLAAQQEYLAEHPELPEDYFESDYESLEKHKIQHSLLSNMLNKGDVNLKNYFKNNEQDEPLLIDQDGFIINGNRRKCAMIELYMEDSIKYKRFDTIQVAILPVCDDKQISELEAMLQIKKDIKAKYNWVSEAFMIRKRQKENSYSDKELKFIYGKDKNDLDELFAMLDEADKYLESRNLSRRYQKVENDEFAFKQIIINKSKLNFPDDKDIFGDIIFCLLDNKNDLKVGRLYEAIKDVANNFEKIKNELKVELDSVLENYKIEKNEQISLLGNFEFPSEQLALALKDKSNSETVLDVTENVILGQRDLDKRKKEADYVMNLLTRANTFIKDALNGFSDTTNVNGVKYQLESIELSVDLIKEKLEEYDIR